MLSKALKQVLAARWRDDVRDFSADDLSNPDLTDLAIDLSKY